MRNPTIKHIPLTALTEIGPATATLHLCDGCAKKINVIGILFETNPVTHTFEIQDLTPDNNSKN